MNHAGIYSICKRLFCPPKHTKWLVEPIQPPVHCVTGVTLSQREALHSLSSRVEVQNEWTYTSTVPYLRGFYRNNFTLPSFDGWHSVGSYDITYVEKVIDFVFTYIEDVGSRSSENCVNVILNSVDKKNQLDVTFCILISLLIVAQHVSSNHVLIIRSWRLRDVIASCWYVPWMQEGGQDYCILYFSSNSCSTCFGQPCAHHQELRTTWCYNLVLVCAVAAGRWSSPVGR